MKCFVTPKPQDTVNMSANSSQIIYESMKQSSSLAIKTKCFYVRINKTNSLLKKLKTELKVRIFSNSCIYENQTHFLIRKEWSLLPGGWRFLITNNQPWLKPWHIQGGQMEVTKILYYLCTQFSLFRTFTIQRKHYSVYWPHVSLLSTLLPVTSAQYSLLSTLSQNIVLSTLTRHLISDPCPAHSLLSFRVWAFQ